MVRLAHIVNPVFAPEAAELMRAQPITFETMRRAQAAADHQVEVSLYATGYAEDLPVFPKGFEATPLLERSVLDVASFRVPRRLPLLADIVQRLADCATADYLIISNVDIALQPHFYTQVAAFISAGHDAFVINRRTISAHYERVDQIPAMQREKGRPHRGWDCFVFRYEYQPRLLLGHICIGAPRAGLALLSNLVAQGEQFREFDDQFLTFHIGDDQRWRSASLNDYATHNTRELSAILAELQERFGPFPAGSIPHSYLARQRLLGPLYEYWARSAYLPPGLARRLNRFLRRSS